MYSRCGAWLVGTLLCSGLTATACTQGDVGSSRASLSSATLDDAPELFPGVVEVRSGGVCSGTVVATRDDRAWILTAAHCFISRSQPVPAAPSASVAVRFGPDVATATPFPAVAVHVHPHFAAARIEVPEAFDAWPITQAYDFAIVEITGVDPSLSGVVIPTATSGEDGVLAGTAADGVGYGRIRESGTTDGRRRRATFTVSRIAAGPDGFESIIIDQREGAGFCPGDSGGPLVYAGRVVGVLSGVAGAGTALCGNFALSSRASLASAELVEPVIAGTPREPASCLSCAFEATSAGGTCAAAVTSDAAERQRFESCVVGADTWSACRTRIPVGAAAYDAAWSCLTDTACAGLCSGVERVRFQCQYSLDGNGPCDACLQANCCEEMEACRGDDVCASCTDTLGVAPAPCITNTAYRTVRACLDNSCDAACGVYTAPLPTLPTPDAGVSSDAGAEDAAIVAPDAGAALPPAGCSCRADGSGWSSHGARLLLALLALFVASRGRARSGAATQRL